MTKKKPTFNANLPIDARKVESTEQLGAIIRECRKQQKLRQGDLADAISASHVYLRDVETGKPTANWGGVFEIFDELGIEVYIKTPDDQVSDNA